MKSTERVILESILCADAPANSLLPLDAFESMDIDVVANTQKKRRVIAANLANVCQTILKIKDQIITDGKKDQQTLLELKTLDHGIIAGYMLGKYGSPQNEFLDQLASSFRMAKQTREAKDPEFYEKIKKEKEEFLNKCLNKSVKEGGVSEDFANKVRNLMGDK